MNPFFVESFDMREHPIKKSNMKIQTKYIVVLTYIIEKTINEMYCCQPETKKYVTARLQLYRGQLPADVFLIDIDDKKRKRCLSTFARPWLNKYRYMLICDVALILFEDNLVLRAVEIIKEQLPTRCRSEVDKLYSLLHAAQEIEKKYRSVSLLVKQYRTNKSFLLKTEKRIIVTANVSAGKSTLINALVGKPITRTSQEVCTGNICYLFNKAYEDGNIHLLTQKLSLNATVDELRGYDWNGYIYMASYFVSIVSDTHRLCIVDTPGVDAALYKEHSQRAYDTLLNDPYDTILYVVSPTRLKTEAEQRHLQWVFQNLQNKSIIFVLNKIDDYHDISDSIEESIHDFRANLESLLMIYLITMMGGIAYPAIQRK